MSAVKPADLRPGDRIVAAPTIGVLTVTAAPYRDVTGDPEWDRVYVDVEPADRSMRWNPDHLPVETGAEAMQFLGLLPLRYRLVFLPDHNITIEETP